MALATPSPLLPSELSKQPPRARVWSPLVSCPVLVQTLKLRTQVPIASARLSHLSWLVPRLPLRYRSLVEHSTSEPTGHPCHLLSLAWVSCSRLRCRNVMTSLRVTLFPQLLSCQPQQPNPLLEVPMQPNLLPVPLLLRRAPHQPMMVVPSLPVPGYLEVPLTGATLQVPRA